MRKVYNRIIKIKDREHHLSYWFYKNIDGTYDLFSNNVIIATIPNKEYVESFAEFLLEPLHKG